MSNFTNNNDCFDWGAHYLRAFAIVAILITHFWCYSGLIEEAHAFFTGSTIYFLFISGYLCQYLASLRPIVAKRYYCRKLTNVCIPYLLWSCVTLLVVTIVGDRPGVISREEVYWGNLPQIILFGWAQVPYWYIPFVCLLFLFSPMFSKLSTKALVWLVIVSSGFAVCFPFRPAAHIDGRLMLFFFQYVCFGWCYLLGFLYARIKTMIDPFLPKYVIPTLFLGLLLGFAALAPDLFILHCCSDVDPIPDTHAIVLMGSSARSFQKLLFLVPAIVLTNKFSKCRIRVLDWLATCSFTMYFTHQLFVKDFVVVQDWLFVHCGGGQLAQCGLRLLVTVLFISFNLLLAMFLKKMFGRYSRCIIGS